MDVLTHITDLLAFRQEVIDKEIPVFSLNEDGSIEYLGTNFPAIYSGNESISLVRGGDSNILLDLDTVNRIGVCENGEYLFDSEDGRLDYERIRGWTEEESLNGEYKAPYKFGVFL